MKTRFNFKPVTLQDKELIVAWLEQEHVKTWLHGEGLTNTLIDLDRFIKREKSFMHHWIAYDQSRPFAYLITSEVAKNKPEEDDLAKYCEEEGLAITLDLFICDLEYLGKGLAVQMIHEFLESQFPHAAEVFIDPEAANSRAVHVYQKTGFRIIGEFIAKWHPVPHFRMRLKTKDLLKNKNEKI